MGMHCLVIITLYFAIFASADDLMQARGNLLRV